MLELRKKFVILHKICKIGLILVGYGIISMARRPVYYN